MERLDSQETHRRARISRARQMRRLMLVAWRALREPFRVRDPRLSLWRTIG
jgi:hypothetical protein